MTFAALTIPVKVFAQSLPALYWNLGYGNIETKNPKLNLDIVTATFGADLSKYLAIEGYLGTGIGTAKYNTGNTTLEANINSIYGINLKPKYAVTKNLTLFANAGYRRAEEDLKDTASAAKATITSDGWLVGLGGRYKVTERFYINTSYNLMETNDNDNANLFTVGFGQQF